MQSITYAKINFSYCRIVSFWHFRSNKILFINCNYIPYMKAVVKVAVNKTVSVFFSNIFKLSLTIKDSCS